MFAGDVIYALVSAPGRAGVAVVRISGGGADAAFPALTRSLPPPPRRASLRQLKDPIDGTVLDRALVLWFPGPASFTGEDVAELHLHAGPAVIEGVLAALGRLPSFRPAEAGEFTRRAFRNGKLDLAEAEGLADLIDADSAAGRGQALWQMQGGLSAIYARWREELTGILAFAEAALDFADEAVPDDLQADVARRTEQLLAELRGQLAQGTVTERLNDGLRIVLTGAPNVGKSSLLNALARREAAIVTEIPGTTRDVLEVRLTLSGYPVALYDTAGLRESADPVEREGVRRARAAAAEADLIVEVRDAREASSIPAPTATQGRLVFWNKLDLTAAAMAGGLAGSATTGVGLDRLEDALTQAAKAAIEGRPAPAITRARHRAALTDAAAALERALTAPAQELAAEDLRTGLTALGRVVGVVDVEDVLDRVFAAFCIGK